MIKYICRLCKKEFLGYKSQERIYCSRKCSPSYKKGHIPWSKSQKGIHLSPKTEYKKGNISWSKLHPKLMPRGSKHGMWKGGKYKTSTGYFMIYSPTHPFKNCDGYVREHRLVMEKHLGRYLRTSERVHHINGNTLDNKLINLKLFPNHSKHLKYHAFIRHKSK